MYCKHNTLTFISKPCSCVCGRKGQKSSVDLLDVKQVASMLMLSRRTIWRWVDSGRLPKPMVLNKEKIGRGATCRWSLEQINDFIDKTKGE